MNVKHAAMGFAVLVVVVLGHGTPAAAQAAYATGNAIAACESTTNRALAMVVVRDGVCAMLHCTSWRAACRRLTPARPPAVR